MGDEMSKDDRISYLMAIMSDPDAGRFFDDEQWADMETELEELREHQ